jgi:hypothetical protein
VLHGLDDVTGHVLDVDGTVSRRCSVSSQVDRHHGQFAESFDDVVPDRPIERERVQQDDADAAQ